MDDYLRGMAPFDPNGSLSPADADRIWASYKAAGGGRDVSASLPNGGGLPSGDGGRFTGAGPVQGFGSLGGGGLLASIAARMNPNATPGAPAPQVPADGSMQPTIGPGMPAAPPVAPGYTPQLGLPKGGLLGLMQGGKPNGIMGLLQNKFPGLLGGGPLAGAMPAAGMLPQVPGAAETPAGLPMNITRDNQF